MRLRLNMSEEQQQLVRLGDEVGEAGLRRLGHMKRRDGGYSRRRMPDGRKRRRPKRRLLNVVEEDEQLGCVTEEALDRTGLKQVVATPKGKNQKIIYFYQIVLITNTSVYCI